MRIFDFKSSIAGVATQLKGALYNFNGTLSAPYTPPTWWADRYVLCNLQMRKPSGEVFNINDAVVSLSRPTHIVQTQIVGRKGTVKEYINQGDYQLSILVGIAATDENEDFADVYPSDNIRTLLDFLNEESEIRVYSEFLDIFEITHIVITQFALNQSTESNYQTITINALSDNPDEYNLYGV